MVDSRDEHLEWAVFGGRFGNVRENRFEERLEIGTLVLKRFLRDALLRDREDYRKIGLLFAGAQFDEEVEDFVDDFGWARILSVDLIDDHDGSQVEFEGLAQHEACLRHHAFGRIDQQQHALHHLQHALYLAAEIGVARRVHDVEFGFAVAHGGVFGQNGNAALAFERVGVHDARLDLLAFAEDTALFEHGVNERGLAVVDVGDDGNVADIRSGLQSARWIRHAGRIHPVEERVETLVVGIRLGNGEPKRGSAARFEFDVDAAVHHADQLFTDIEPQAGGLVAVR